MQVMTTVDTSRIAPLRARDEFFWLDLEDPGDSDVHAIGEALGLHGLAVEDTRNFGQRPKVDDFGTHVLLVFYSVGPASEAAAREIEPLEVHLYVSGGFVVTVRRRPCPELDSLRQSLEGAASVGESLVVYRILRALCEAFEQPLHELEARIDSQEDAVFTGSRHARLETIYHLRQEVHDLLRRMASQRDQFRYAADALASVPGLSQGPGHELRDIGDRLDEIAGELERQNGDIASLVAVYFNTTAAKVNVLATRLSLIATFFLAWTLVTGFFGQNFGWMVDHLATRQAFLIYGVGGLGLATLVAGAVVWLGRRRRDG